MILVNLWNAFQEKGTYSGSNIHWTTFSGSDDTHSTSSSGLENKYSNCHLYKTLHANHVVQIKNLSQKEHLHELFMCVTKLIHQLYRNLHATCGIWTSGYEVQCSKHWTKESILWNSCQKLYLSLKYGLWQVNSINSKFYDIQVSYLLKYRIN